MKVPFSLHKTDRPGPATALLLLSEQAAELLGLCARIAADVPETAREWPALPPIHAVPGGFLVKLGRPVAAVFPGTIRLRSLSANLFLPFDAELAPSLLDDEAAGLVRERGLIFLPGGRVLAFAPDRLVTADMLLSISRLPGHAWSALPARLARPERLEEILLDLPDDSPGLILQRGGEDIGVEAPRPADAGPIARAAGRTALGAGQGLAWLGEMLNWPGLAALGAALAGGALRAAPRLSESLLGMQEAALRELLRKFRAGDLEEALRHALPLSNSSGRGGQPAADANLPTHGLRYRLADLLNGAQGPASNWFSSAEVHAELTREYRKAAEAATARGDYRRAAFIYGRLFNDYRRAAEVLARGGLHHDAAVIYLEILGDSLAAARAFEAAGETDRALRLYLQRGEHVLAGDLLRRLGEEDAALRHYLRAADQLAAADNHLAAADLLLGRAQRPDLARAYLADGWARRPRGSAIPCLMRLTQSHAEQDEQQQLLSLVAEAEEFFAPPGDEHGASQFFNALAQVADRANLSALRDELRDRALCGLANKLRHRAETDLRPGFAVSELFGRSGPWKAALVSDADFALKAAFKKKEQPSKPSTPASRRLRIGPGQVTAVCAARVSGRIFVADNQGRTGYFDPHSETLIRLAPSQPEATILALSTNDRGDRLIALTRRHAENSLLAYAVSPTGYKFMVQQSVPRAGTNWLTPIAERDGQSVIGYWNGDSLHILWSEDLLPLATYARSGGTARAGLLFMNLHRLAAPDVERPGVHVCLFVGEALWYFESFGKGPGTELRLGWRPGSRLRGLCSPPPLSWGWRGTGPLELVGIDEDDSIHWSELDCRDPAKPVVSGGASTQASYRAAALVRPGLIAGVHERGVDWLHVNHHQLLPRSATLVTLEDAVACATSPPTRELLVICRDASVVRVPLPS
jgi:tetratricopeptide (TPR) repeat protein